jgi:hypothetical protein
MTLSERSKRQSFLGENSEQVLMDTTVAVIGASGGGSPIAQQLAHVGYGRVHLIDPALTQAHHTHRLIGVSTAAVRRCWPKVGVVRRQMLRVHPQGQVFAHAKRWQAVAPILNTCDLVFTCVDGYLAREEIERYLRRYLVPMVDVGMDVTEASDGYLIRGQVILSMPGSHCMRCFGLVRDELLREEAARYGQAGDNPQVVWPNGVLASTAVGVATSLLLPWQTSRRPCPYLVYNGNTFELVPSPRLPYVTGPCPHFSDSQIPGALVPS